MACDVTCVASYFFSLPDGEFLGAIVGLMIVLPMLMTTCHEAGHYYAAKLCGIDSIEFALGKGPAILRVPVTPSGCELALCLVPFGGRVTYDDRYWQASYMSRAFISAAGWMADVIVAAIVVSTVYLTKAEGPVATIACYVAAYKVAVGLVPFTRNSDGRKIMRYIWLANTADKRGA